MKKLLLLTLSTFFCLASFSQSQNNYSYTFGVKLLSYSEYPKLLNEVRSSENYRSSYLNSFLFKFNDNQISYRIIGSKYNNADYEFKNECKDCETVKGKFSDFTLKLGFERSIIYGSIQPFYGLDLGYKKVTFDGESYNSGSTTSQYNALIEKNGAVIYPFLGVKVNLIDAKVTISAEAGIDMLYSHDKETKTFNDANKTRTVNNFKRWGYYNQPLSMLSLQYNFGAQ